MPLQNTLPWNLKNMFDLQKKKKKSNKTGQWNKYAFINKPRAQETSLEFENKRKSERMRECYESQPQNQRNYKFQRGLQRDPMRPCLTE